MHHVVGAILTAVHIAVNHVVVTITETIDQKVQIQTAVRHVDKINQAVVVVVDHMEIAIENLTDPIVAVNMIEMSLTAVHIAAQTNHVVAIKVG